MKSYAKSLNLQPNKMMRYNPDLKPCPFCGNAAQEFEYDVYYGVGCQHDDCPVECNVERKWMYGRAGDPPLEQLWEEMRTIWNQRAGN